MTEKIPVQIVMDDEDFSHLCSNSTAWASGADDKTNKGRTFPGWRRQIADGRFELSGSANGQPALHWKIAYWVGSDYTAVILAKSFLAAKGFECQVAWDLAEPGEWVILTDYDYIWQQSAVTQMPPQSLN